MREQHMTVNNGERVIIRCETCGATGSGRAKDEPDVNACEITEFPEEWEGGEPADCQHEGELSIEWAS